MKNGDKLYIPLGHFTNNEFDYGLHPHNIKTGTYGVGEDADSITSVYDEDDEFYEVVITKKVKLKIERKISLIDVK